MARAALVVLALVAGCSNGTTPAASPSATKPPPSTTTTTASATPTAKKGYQEYAVPAGSRPHDVAVTADGIVWYTGQAVGVIGKLDPANGHVTQVPLAEGAHPHGVIIGPDGAPWVTEAGLNAIVRIDPTTLQVRTFPLPANRPNVGLNTAAFDSAGTLWFTGNAGWYGRLTPSTGKVDVYEAPRGGGPYGITATKTGVYYSSLQGDHVAHVDPKSAKATVLVPPTSDQGSRRAWADSTGRVWVSQWDAGQVAVYDPATKRWREWRLPGGNPQAYAVFVDDEDVVWLSDFGANALVSFDPKTEKFDAFPLPSTPANVRQIHGRPGEVWGAESAADKLVVYRH